MNEPDILSANDEIARKFKAIEADIEGCAGVGELFATLLSASREAFAIPFVWLSLVEGAKTAPLLPLLHEEGLCDRVAILSPASFREVVPDTDHPLLAGGDLKPFFRLLPPRIKYLIRSLAVAPLTCDGFLIGSLNHGDVHPGRYRPGMETALLDHLARTVSGRISQLLPPEPPGRPQGGA